MESLKITPNGNLLYSYVNYNGTSELGIIGPSSLVIADDPARTTLPTASVTVNFTVGRMVADPVRDLVYVADQTDGRVFAVNTDSGTDVASQSLTGEPGALAVSVDDNYLYVAEPEGLQIQVLSLPSLTPVTTLNVGFEVDNLVATVHDDLLVSVPTSNSGQNPSTRSIRQQERCFIPSLSSILRPSPSEPGRHASLHSRRSCSGAKATSMSTT